MEPYIAIDPVWGWLGTLYLGVPVLCLFALLVLGAVGAPHLTFHKKRIFYPILRIVRRGARKEILLLKLGQHPIYKKHLLAKGGLS